MLSRYISRLENKMRQFVITYKSRYFNIARDTFISGISEASIFKSYKDAYDLIRLKGFIAFKVQELKTEIKVEDAKVPFSLFLEDMVNGKAGRVILLITSRDIPSCIIEDKEANIFILRHLQSERSLLNSIRSSSKTTYIVTSTSGYDALGINADIIIQSTGDWFITYKVLKNRGTGIINTLLEDD